ncbi:M66 family metalloprotease [Luteimonas sp. MC1895]|uniref:M66 family metalloprotease n=1 Tax=Luteimonas sp. MC1895 TaxID=2819513 RepID=UPI0018F0A8E0|nr:M66 family metalloprotease [Luteimonas sp. MC1895]MBJ6979437.1 hypothetical protein [Luteimonas sp. MC1895]
MEIRSASLNFPRMRGSGPRTAEQTIVFPRQIDAAVASLAGYSAGFRGGDHHLGRLQVQLATEVNANVVTVRATFGLRDWSGDWDDDYAGTVEASVLAELVDASLPPPRGDLQITGIEVNQATQAFRSAQHLDADHVLPDNAISLVGGKATGVRVYVDFGAEPALPAIARLSGELEVSIGSNVLLLPPIATIVPRRDSEIDRGEAGHTLNFSIPGAWCRGSVDIRCRVFASTDPGQASAFVRRSLRFVDVNPMRVFGVGIHYTGQGMDLPAPDATTVLGTFDLTRRLFPVGDVLLSGYTAMDFSDDMVTTDTDGCGDGFEALNSNLKDLRGDSDDLYYGLLPTGVNFGNFVGCGGGGVGSGVVGDMGTAAHEAGHAYGRKHAPCDDSARCSNPSNQDGDYPHYALFHSDSVGEFGFDPAANRVFDPASAHDIMGYSGTKWVSPYTYAGLMTRTDPVEGASAVRSLDSALHAVIHRPQPRAEWSGKPVPLMQLEVHIDHDRKVTIPHVFTYAAQRRLRGSRATPFRVQVRDADGKPRACAVLHGDCFHCGADCWPQHLAAEVPMDPLRARKLVVYEGDMAIAAFDIPQPPVLHVEGVEYKDKDHAILRWSAKDERDLVYLVHWQDESGAWRGIAPRRAAREIEIPARLRSARRPLRVRVLASNGLATAIEETSVDPLRKRRDPDKEPPVVLEVPDTDGPIVRAWAVDRLGRSLPGAEIRWFDEKGGEIGRGEALDTRLLAAGARVVRVVAVNAGAGKAERDVSVVGRKEPPPVRRPPQADPCARHEQPRDDCQEKPR